MMAAFSVILDPLSPHQKKTKKKNRVGPPLAKLAGSAHEYQATTRTVGLGHRAL